MILWLTPWVTAAEPDPYQVTWDLIQTRYLEASALRPDALLDQALRRAATEVPPLLLSRVDGGTALRRGSEPPLGVLRADDGADLVRALRQAEVWILQIEPSRTPQEVQRLLLGGLLDGLDLHSRLLVDEGVEHFRARLQGTVVGPGLELAATRGALHLQVLHPGGPAERAGLRVGDRVTAIAGLPVGGVEEAQARLKGPIGSEVELTLEREGRPLVVRLRREETILPTVRWQILEGDVAWIALDHISQRTRDHLDRVLTTLRAEGGLSRGIVLDLRGNSGGSMKEAVRVADAFLGAGELLRTEGPDGGEVPNLEHHMAGQDQPEDIDLPLAVLVDRRTASAAEIIAGNLLARERAVLIGQRTWGKGTVQQTFPVAPLAEAKLTVARFRLAEGWTVPAEGFRPDQAIGQVHLATNASWRGFQPSEAGHPWPAVLPEVRVDRAWAGEDALEPDLGLELARRALLRTASAAREALLSALAEEADQLRASEEAQLQAALAARGLDWRPAPEEALTWEGALRLRSEELGPGVWQVEASFHNTTTEPLHRVMLTLDAPYRSPWDQLNLVLGRVPPGERATAVHQVTLPPGRPLKQEEVRAFVQVDRGPGRSMGPFPLSSRSGPGSRLIGELARTGPQRAELALQLREGPPVKDLELSFRWPPGTALATEAELPTSLSPGQTLRLPLVWSTEAAAPFRVEVEAGDQGRLAGWTLSVPAEGRVRLEPPRLARPPEGAAGPLTVTDDEALAWVTLSLNGEKYAWYPGNGPKLTVALPEGGGPRRWEIQAADNRGLVLTERWQDP